MPIHPFLLARKNFDLAVERLVGMQNFEYRDYIEHLFPAYGLTGAPEGRQLIAEIRAGTFEPRHPQEQLLPKADGGVRPYRILALRDLHVYYAIANVVASRFRAEQGALADRRRFSNILAAPSANHLFRDWRVSYRAYREAQAAAYDAGKVVVGDLDIVSFYDTIDHQALMRRLQEQVRPQILDLLGLCLSAWSSSRTDSLRGFGIPQGPEPSALLAEVLLFPLDEIALGDVAYFRYVDNVRIMGADERTVHRALLAVEVHARNLGLSPRSGWRAAVWRPGGRDELSAPVASTLVRDLQVGIRERETQRDLERMLKESVQYVRGSGWTVADAQKFRFAVLRLEPKKRLIRSITGALQSRPDLAWNVAGYLKRFPRDAEVAREVLRALDTVSPPYSAAVADLLEALDACEPASGVRPYRSVVRTLEDDFVEAGVKFESARTAFWVTRRRGSGK